MAAVPCPPVSHVVDLQINGYLGTSFRSTDLTPETCVAACRAILAGGVAAFLPTVTTGPLEMFEQNLAYLADVIETTEFQGRVLGIHVEGPFISPEPGYVGAHPVEHVRAPDPSILEQMQTWARGHIRLLTLAAERLGALECIRRARDLGMVVSIGHSRFDEITLAAAVEAGATALTHLGNGLPNDLNRHHNPIWAALANDNVTAMIIGDGHHLPDSLIDVIIRAKGIERTLIVSDITQLGGMPPGQYGEVVLEPSGRISFPARNCLAGSAVTLSQAMRRLAARGCFTESELAQLSFHNPLRLLGLDLPATSANR